MVSMKRSLFLLPLLGGCFSYMPIDPATVPTGTEVRARITGAASDRVAPLLGTFDTRVITGNVVENNSGAMVLDVSMGAMPNVSASVVPLRTRVPIGASDLVSLEQRRMDVGRTALLGGVIAAGVGAGAVLAIRAGGGKGDPGNGPPEPPPIIRIPVWRLHF
jgi:hypothetical protein